MLVSPTVGFAFLAAAVYAQDPRSLSAPGPFEIPILQGMTDIVAQIGPSGGDRGYSAITNMTSFLYVWGKRNSLHCCWYIYISRLYSFAGASHGT